MIGDVNAVKLFPDGEDGEPSARVVRFEGYEIDRDQWQLRWLGEPITVARKPFDLLCYLALNRHRVVTKDELLEKLWPDQFVDENNLAQQVSFLRKALSKHESGKKVIETVAGRGYRFVALMDEPPQLDERHDEVLEASRSLTRITLEEEVETPSDAFVEPVLGLAASPNSKNLATIYTFTGVVAAIGLIVGGYFAWQWWQGRQGGESVEVVLMPLEGNTNDSALDHALNDAVRFDLTQSPFVTVVPAAQVAATLQRMRRKPDEPFTQDAAREVCERTNSQAVVHTVLARSGPGFLLTGEAVGCVDGNTLASATRDAKRAEDLPLTINKLIGSLRHELGESRRSVARFTTPTSVLETASLDAYRASSQAGVLNHQGKYAESVAMYKQAIAFDPNFAGAYLDLASSYMALDDHANASAAATKAYELRNTVSPFLQLAISVRYDELVTGDLYAAEKDALLWTQLYPKFPAVWNYLSIARAELGNHAGAIEPAQKVVALRPDLSDYYAPVCQEQMHAGDFMNARKSCEHELAASPDDEFPHLTLAQIAFSENDSQLAQQQLDWLKQHPKNPLMLTAEAEMSVAKGQFQEAERFITQAAEVYKEQGSPGPALDMTNTIASELLGAGDKSDGSALFQGGPSEASPGKESLVDLVLTGDASKAETLLKEQLTKRPQDTMWNMSRAPEVRGWIALQAGRPEDALKELNQPGVLDERDGIIRYLRGTAYLAARQPQKAEAEFRWVVAHSGLDHSFVQSQSWLGLGRALAAEANRSAAADAYQHFLALWAAADPDAALLKEARSELDQLK